MFKEKLTKNSILVKDSVSDWKEAVYDSVGLLEKNGLVPEDYKEKIVETVEELGPYIFIAPDIALPHVQYFDKTEVGVSLLKLNNKVEFDNERNAVLFFAFSAKDGDSHIQLIQELATFLFDEENVSALKRMDNVDEIYEYIQQHG